MSFIINDNVTWVGKIDWELRTFHGEDLSTHRVQVTTLILFGMKR